MARWTCVAVLAASWATPSAMAMELGPACDGVGVVVDFGGLDGDGVRGCAPLPSGTSTSALEAIRAAGLGVDGTAQWGTAFLCRVDDRPAAGEDIPLPDGQTLRETCSRTPSQQAYWSLWHTSTVAGAPGDWRYATTGASDLTVAAGDVVGLAFTIGPLAQPPSLATDLALAGDLPEGWVEREPASGSGAGTTGGAPSGMEGQGEPAGLGVVPLVGVGLVLAGAAVVVVAARKRR